MLHIKTQYHIKNIKSPRDFWPTMSKLTERGIQFSRDRSYITSSRRGDSHFVCPISLIVLCNNKVNHTLCNMLHRKHNQSKIIVLREENTKWLKDFVFKIRFCCYFEILMQAQLVWDKIYNEISRWWPWRSSYKNQQALAVWAR